jgi:hypothetical protein
VERNPPTTQNIALPQRCCQNELSKIHSNRYRAGVQTDNPNYLAQRERIIEGMRKAGVPEK